MPSLGIANSTSVAVLSGIFAGSGEAVGGGWLVLVAVGAGPAGRKVTVGVDGAAFRGEQPARIVEPQRALIPVRSLRRVIRLRIVFPSSGRFIEL
jgi:hypothetical protein